MSRSRKKHRSKSSLDESIVERHVLKILLFLQSEQQDLLPISSSVQKPIF